MLDNFLDWKNIRCAAAVPGTSPANLSILVLGAERWPGMEKIVPFSSVRTGLWMEQDTVSVEAFLTTSVASTWNKPSSSGMWCSERVSSFSPLESSQWTRGSGNQPSAVHTSWISPATDPSMWMCGADPRPVERGHSPAFSHKSWRLRSRRHWKERVDV